MKTKTVKVEELTEKQRKIVAYLRQQCTPCPPTEIGIQVGGKCYGQASSWACSTLKRLTEMGITERDLRGHYSIHPTVEVPAELVEGEQEPAECPSCHYTVITDDFVYVCQQCGAETCPDCAGRCGCELEEVSDE